MLIDLIGRGWELVAAGVLLAAAIGIITGPGDRFSCAPADSDGIDEGVLMDDAHDRWVDEQSEVA
jgi:hypothetical protein